MASFKAGKYEVFIERVRINRQGYAGGKYGSYYGVTGQDVFRYDTHPFDYALAGEIRASDMKEAKARIMHMAKFQNEINAPKENPRAASSTAVTMKKVGDNYNVCVGGTRVGSFPSKAEAEIYGRHLLKTRTANPRQHRAVAPYGVNRKQQKLLFQELQSKGQYRTLDEEQAYREMLAKKRRRK